jgi:small subunit ribosomal protein S20
MANHSATKKDARQAAKRTPRNKSKRQKTRNANRDQKSTKGAEMGEGYPKVASMIDKLAKRNVIHKNKAANLKSKLARKANKAAAAK